MTTQTQSIYHDLCRVIPAGVSSPVRSFSGLEQTPLVVKSGKGDLIIDVDNKEYIDYCCAWGSLILGHADDGVLESVRTRMAQGTSFGITTEIEQKLAAQMVRMVGGTSEGPLEMVRFVSSGTEATMSAARLARGYTGKSLIVKFDGAYHGHADHFLVKAGSGVASLSDSSSAGIPEDMVKNTISLPYNDIEAVKAFFADSSRSQSQDIAAVIIEPVAGNMGVVPATEEFLQLLREETRRVGALLIFDEVITGFRVGSGCAQERYGIDADLSCYGKVMGGGFPAAAFGGKRKVMEHIAPLGAVYQAGTLSGNPVAMEAGYQTLRRLEDPKFYQELDRKARVIVEPVQEFFSAHNVDACVQRVGSMFTIFLGAKQVCNMAEAQSTDADWFKRFFKYLFDKGIYIPPSQFEAWFVSAAHTEEHLEATRDAILAFFK